MRQAKTMYVARERQGTMPPAERGTVTGDWISLRQSVGILAVLAVYYAALVTNFSFDLTKPLAVGLTFNSMLEHLLRGEFDVDPVAVGLEGFLRDGRVYSYWGVFCAALRLPLVFVRDGLQTDVTVLSCVVALCVSGWFKLQTILFVRRRVPSSRSVDVLFYALLAYGLLGGSQTAFARPTIYQEVLCWAYALTTIFLFCAVRGLISGRFSTALLASMALAAAGALLTRASTGAGLCLALGLMLLTLLWQSARDGDGRRGMIARAFRFVRSPQVLAPSAILVLAVIAVGVINYQRWHDPFTILPLDKQLFTIVYSDRLERAHSMNMFEWKRVPYALMYFFAPVWPFRGTDGGYLFAQGSILFDQLELPPSSFFLTDLVPFVLLAAVAAGTPRPLKAAVPLGPAAALAVGLAVPCVLMLTAYALCHRYRMEFYPALDLLLYLAAYTLAGQQRLAASLDRFRGTIVAAAIISVVGAHGTLLLYKASGLGPGYDALDGLPIARYYYWNFHKLETIFWKASPYPGLPTDPVLRQRYFDMINVPAPVL